MSNKNETWKPVIFQGKKPNVRYAVSDQGRFGVMDVTGNITVRRFKPQAGGYRYNFKIDDKSMALFVYKEVAKAFVKKSSPKQTFIIRKDHNYLNDKASNLKWVTPEEHKLHVTFSPSSVESRKKRAITKSYTAKVFNEKTIKDVKRLIWDPKRKLTFKQIAEKYGVSEMQIYRIKNGELWSHVHVENEPVFKKYKENLKNIAYQEKKALKEKADKEKLLKERLAKQKKVAEKRAKLKAEIQKRIKLRKERAEQNRKAKAAISKNYQKRVKKAAKKHATVANRKAANIKKRAVKKATRKSR